MFAGRRGCWTFYLRRARLTTCFRLITAMNLWVVQASGDRDRIFAPPQGGSRHMETPASARSVPAMTTEMVSALVLGIGDRCERGEARG
jgi:hypothetical protein